MAIEFKDYYAVLGVARTATDTEIKQAFRKIARKNHPDVAKGKDPAAAEDKFKEANEANEVLSDPEKRRKYDELGARWDHPDRQPPPPWDKGNRGPGAGTQFHFDGTGFSDFFEQFFSSQSRPFADFGDTRGNGTDDRDFAQRGQDIEGNILVTLGEALQGSTRTIRLQRTEPRTGQSTFQTLRVKIPPGVREGQLIRLAGKGQEGLGGGDSGSLYLRVTFARHPDFQPRGADLYFTLELTPWEAVLGATIHVTTLDGKVTLKIPPGTVADREFRFHGKGLPLGKGKRGNLHAVVSIQVPPQLTPEQKALWEQLATTSTFNPRKAS